MARLRHHLAAVLVFGSGLVNIISASSKALMLRQKLLLLLFPLEFIRLSNFLTLIIGVTLMITAVNLFKRKRRAYRLAVILSGLAVIFHLAKGLDIEEAVLSAAVTWLLWSNRRQFTVESAEFKWRPALINSLFLLGLTLVYALSGFWIFGRHDRFFLETLNALLIFAWVFGLLNLFGPAAYFYFESSIQKQRAKKIIGRFGQSSLDYFKLWPNKSLFFDASRQGFISYCVNRGVAVALGDPVGPDKAILPLLKGFRRFCYDNGWRPAFHQTLPNYLSRYRRLKFKSFKVGDEAIVDLNHFSLEGKEAKKKRYIVNKLSRLGYRCKFLPPPLPPTSLNRLKKISDDWLKIPGRRERGFSQGYFQENYLKATACLVAVDPNERWLAFANLLPADPPQEATIDLMRHRRSAPAETMDFLLINLFLRLKKHGFGRFNLGLSPMSGKRALDRLAQSTNFLFSFKGLKYYKDKYADYWEPRYLIYRSFLDLPRIARAVNHLSKVI